MSYSIIESIRFAMLEKRLPDIFGPEEFKRACPGFADRTYHVFLPKHRICNPGEYTEYFERHTEGRYSFLF